MQKSQLMFTEWDEIGRLKVNIPLSSFLLIALSLIKIYLSQCPLLLRKPCSSMLLQTNLHKIAELESLVRESWGFMDAWVQVCPEGTGCGEGIGELCAVWCMGEAAGQEDLAMEGCGGR